MTTNTLMLTSLTGFYQKNPEQSDRLYYIIEGLSPISLRVIDWFITHYAKQHNIVYWINSEKKFNLYLEYRGQLKAYTKILFDPFRRHERITFVIDRDDSDSIKTIETTVGQLNFFRWALQNQVIDYIQEHLAEIEYSMSQKNKNKTLPVLSPVQCVTSMHKNCQVKIN